MVSFCSLYWERDQISSGRMGIATNLISLSCSPNDVSRRDSGTNRRHANLTFLRDQQTDVLQRRFEPELYLITAAAVHYLTQLSDTSRRQQLPKRWSFVPQTFPSNRRNASSPQSLRHYAASRTRSHAYHSADP